MENSKNETSLCLMPNSPQHETRTDDLLAQMARALGALLSARLTKRRDGETEQYEKAKDVAWQKAEAALTAWEDYENDR